MGGKWSRLRWKTILVWCDAAQHNHAEGGSGGIKIGTGLCMTKIRNNLYPQGDFP